MPENWIIILIDSDGWKAGSIPWLKIQLRKRDILKRIRKFE